MPDRNGKIFYTSITSLSHISKKTADESQEPEGKVPESQEKSVEDEKVPVSLCTQQSVG